MLFDSILVVVLIICCITDLKYQKIYNKIVFPSLAMVILLHFIQYGFSGLKLSIGGFLAGFCILLVPYFLGGIGAGDVKLLALVGAVKGSIFVVNAAIYMALTGGAIALILILLHKEFLNFVKRLTTWIYSLFWGIQYKLELPVSVFQKKYPYGVAIASGAFICLFFKGAWII